MNDKRSGASRLGDHADHYELIGNNRDSLASNDELDGATQPRGLPWHKVDDLSPRQVAAMQYVDDARRAGVLTSDQADELFAMVRAGQVAGARKRLTQARKAARS